MEELKNCPICHNHCPIDSLSCDRGRNYFSASADPENPESRDSRDGREDREKRYDRAQGVAGSREHSWEHGGEHGGEHSREHDEEGRHDHRERMHDHGGSRHGSGREEHLQGDAAERQNGWEQKEDLYSLMKACGHYLHHNSGHGDTQTEILKLLDRNGEMPQQEVQDVLRIQSGSVSEIITKLERKGLVERKKMEDDQRKIVLVLTEEGKKTGTASEEKESSDLFRSLDAQQKEELKEMLKVLLHDWKSR